jgi:phosphoglycerate dehydrogenase-like enzyme
MDPDSWLINVARPNLVDREAFLKALDENQLAGAGLDVIWGEPADPNDLMFKDPRLSLSPHTGGVTDEFYKGAIAGIKENLSRQRDGREILNVVNKVSK